MPRDDWQRARDRDTANRANQEFAQFGRLENYERVEADIIPDPRSHNKNATSQVKRERIDVSLNKPAKVRDKLDDDQKQTQQHSTLPGSSARKSITGLVDALAKQDIACRQTARRQIIARGVDAIPGLIALLKTPHLTRQCSAATVLGLFGVAAKVAIPELYEAAMSSDSLLREKATSAIMSIQGKAKATKNTTPKTYGRKHNGKRKNSKKKAQKRR